MDFPVYDTGGDVDIQQLQHDREEELDAALMIMSFLFAPIILGILLALWICCRGYRDTSDVPELQTEANPAEAPYSTSAV